MIGVMDGDDNVMSFDNFDAYADANFLINDEMELYNCNEYDYHRHYSDAYTMCVRAGIVFG